MKEAVAAFTLLVIHCILIMEHSHHHHHHTEAGQLAQVVLERIQTQGLRLTTPRRRLVDLLAHTREPLVFDILLERLGTSFDKVTLYRNLSAFETVGVIQCIRDSDGKTRYELVSPHHHHHHVVCRGCGDMECLPECDVDNFVRQAEHLGYHVEEHRVEVYGLCPNCRPGS